MAKNHRRFAFYRLAEELHWESDPVRSKYTCYSCRHTFAHRMLSGYWTNGDGCSIETLAELLGDTPKVAFAHYGKEWGQHYQGPLWAAIGENGDAPDAPHAVAPRNAKSSPITRPPAVRGVPRKTAGGRRG